MRFEIPGAKPDNTRTQIFSSGGGVQSSAIIALIVMGELDKPDLSIIADTEREKSTTWEYLDNVTKPALKNVGVDIQRVKKSQFSNWGLYISGSLAIPAFTDASGDVGKLRAFCSSEWKKRVVERWATAQGVKKAQKWIGFSVDEIGRASRLLKSASNKWGVRFPLIELGLNRKDCVDLVVGKMGWPPAPRSSCWMCSNMHMREWREVKESQDWGKVVAFEKEIRLKDKHVWLTDQCVPIEQADFSIKNELLWGDTGAECESGLCFV
jgi:hypothetical protein